VDGELAVSVVADVGADAGAGTGGPGGRVHDGIRTTTVTDGESTWVEARWTPAGAAQAGAPPA
jgi:hypothetical protein